MLQLRTVPTGLFCWGPRSWSGAASAWQVARRQARGLLYRLAAHTEPAPREELCFTFWPDVPEAESRRRLSHLITQLRQSLPLPAVVRGRNELVDLDRHLIWSDSVVFTAACDARTPRRALPQPALELYRGPFMSGFSLAGCPEFGDWVSAQRTHFERLYLDALTAIINSEAGRKRTTTGQSLYARRYLRVNELAEDVHRQLMMLHLLVGRPAGSAAAVRALRYRAQPRARDRSAARNAGSLHRAIME